MALPPPAWPISTPAFLQAHASPALAPGLTGTEGPDLTRYLLVCAGLVVLVGALGWLVRRLFARSLKERAARRCLQVTDLLPLGGKQRLAVVRCYDRSFLLGLGEKEVALLAELDAAPAQLERTAVSTELRSFSDLLLRARPSPAGERRALDPEGILG